MAKATETELQYYRERVVSYQEAATRILEHEEAVVTECRQTREGAAVKLFWLAGSMCDLASQYLVINGVSRAILSQNDEDALNESRKAVYKAMIYLETVVTNLTDVPFAEYEPRLAEIASNADAAARYAMVRKVGLTIDLLKEAYGTNTKWKWAFVDIEGRLATVTKNLFDLKNAVQNMQPGGTDYEITVYHYRLLCKLLDQAGDRYVQRYQLSTKNSEEMRLAVNCISALIYVCNSVGNRDLKETALKKQQTWQAMYDSALLARKTAAGGGAVKT